MLSVLFLLISTLSFSQAIKVEVVNQDDHWTFLRDGKPYYVKGAGGEKQLDKLIEIGGNSIRTWGIDNAQEVLDEAHKKGLTVMLGFWVQHERHGFDYNDEKAVKKQLEGFKRAVLKYKDHPALLLWGIGNEVDLNYSNTKVWDAIQDMAKIAHDLDPNHPTTTVTAGLDANEVKLIMEKAPDIDVYSVNTYGDVGNVPKNIAKFGWTGPYMITEWGPNGHWESPKTDWGVPIEQTSKEKAVSYATRYQKFIWEQRSHCIGSYVFLWGQKQETTATWYGLFSVDGLASEAIDELHIAWKKGNPENSCPSLDDIKVDGKIAKDNIYLKSGNTYQAEVATSDIDNDKLTIRWEVIQESTDIKSGGDKESAPPAVPGTIKKQKDGKLTFRAPKKEGAYRLFVYIEDKNGHFATANVPFYCLPRTKKDGQSRFVEFKALELDI